MKQLNTEEAIAIWLIGLSILLLSFPAGVFFAYKTLHP